MVGKETAPGQQAYSSGKSYTLSQKVNISKGNDNFFDLFKMVKNVPVKKIFTATVEAGVARQEINFTT